MTSARFVHPHSRVPRPTARNPFKAGSPLARQFDGCLKAYANGHRDMRRGAGNAWAGAFWRGYDSVPPLTTPRGSFGWACYRAGQAQRILDDRAKAGA